MKINFKPCILLIVSNHAPKSKGSYLWLTFGRPYNITPFPYDGYSYIKNSYLGQKYSSKTVSESVLAPEQFIKTFIHKTDKCIFLG